MYNTIIEQNSKLIVDGHELGKLLDVMPNGWRLLNGATTAPRGYKWITNGKSIFSKEYQHALIKV